ncbi:hypothetical protein SEA_CLOWN_24 [Gordonia phage Clown]|uniref:Uncharacterized protein n=1 Tax=Gordonia phage Clown TaxID=2759393 RepID=A0A7L7SHW6_9CAUD|nr:hypothetical protein KNV25_gp24 [Gordonia phage Clown]QOC56022.1 hypothetical protein SEA_CLOWN_24 [Gordonia phage Clown]
MPAPVYVNRPPAQDVSRFGLLSIASMPTDGGDRAVFNGIEYELPPTPEAVSDPAACIGVSDTPLDWDTAGMRGKPTGESDPIRAWAGFECATVGLTEQEVSDFARTKLAAAEGVFLEDQLWSHTSPALMSDDTVLIGQYGGLSLRAAIGYLERSLHKDYAGVGAIHIPRELAAYADELGIVHQSGSKLTTMLGTPISFGAYPNTDVDGVAAADGTFWIAASGDVSIRRSEVRVTARVDHRHNNWHGIAERTFVVAFDQVSYAIPVSLPSDFIPTPAPEPEPEP